MAADDLLSLIFDGEDVVFLNHEGKEVDRWTEEDRVDLSTTLASMAWSVDQGEDFTIIVGGACPVQGEGNIDGLPLYFRARGDHWSLRIAQHVNGDPVSVAWDELRSDPGWWTECPYGEDYAAGWMSGEHSRLCVMAAIRSWRAAGGTAALLGCFQTVGAPEFPADE
jgi:hypothetical protein